ncbi:hypothetical protein VNI00_017076 [Paramarasmius palmivorus]|uniref:Uncharacterized protein n=1 Tax=Paramarasmius palmivorus TaxID=297713 RepID=A0AAW0B7Q3_9AGAR
MSKRAAPSSRSPSPSRQRRYSEQGSGRIEKREDDAEQDVGLSRTSTLENAGFLDTASSSLFSRFSFLSASTSSMSSSSTAVEMTKPEPSSPRLSSPALVATTSAYHAPQQQVWYSSISNATKKPRIHHPRSHPQSMSPSGFNPEATTSRLQTYASIQAQSREEVIAMMENTLRELLPIEMEELNRIRAEKERLTEEVDELRVRAELEGQAEVLREIRAMRSEIGDIKMLKKEIGELKAELQGVKTEIARDRTTSMSAISAPPRINPPQLLALSDPSPSSMPPPMLTGFVRHTGPLCGPGVPPPEPSIPSSLCQSQPASTPAQATSPPSKPSSSRSASSTSVTGASSNSYSTLSTAPSSRDCTLVAYAHRFHNVIQPSTTTRVVRQQTAFGVRIPDEVWDEREFQVPMWIWQRSDSDVRVKQEERSDSPDLDVARPRYSKELAPEIEEVTKRYLLSLARVLASVERRMAEQP